VQASRRYSTATGLSIVACVIALVAPSLASAGTAQIEDPDPGGPHLTFTAASGEANHVLLLLGFGGYRVVDLGAAITAGPGCAAVNSSEVFCAFTLVFEETPTVDIFLGDLNDFASISPKFSTETTIDGEDGADALEISAGCESEDAVCNLLLRGGPGDDTLRAVNAFALLDGGAGGDTMEGIGAEVDYRARVNPVIVVGNGVADDGEAGEGDNVSANVDDVLGGSAGDTFTDVDAAGRGGNDTFISTGAGGVFCDGGSGDDVLIGGARADFCFGGRGEDDLKGGGGSDDLEGGGGADTIRGGPGRDFLFGGPDDDLLVGGDGREFGIIGGRGDDTLRARDGLREQLGGGPGSDRARVDSIDVVSSIEAFF
jgi:Ca2+-binding RTX toxin-like protein